MADTTRVSRQTNTKKNPTKTPAHTWRMGLSVGNPPLPNHTKQKKTIQKKPHPLLLPLFFPQVPRLLSGESTELTSAVPHLGIAYAGPSTYQPNPTQPQNTPFWFSFTALLSLIPLYFLSSSTHQKFKSRSLVFPRPPPHHPPPPNSPPPPTSNPHRIERIVFHSFSLHTPPPPLLPPPTHPVSSLSCKRKKEKKQQ